VELSGTNKTMGKSIIGTKKRAGRGRPKTEAGSGVQLGMRWPQEQLDRIDGWASDQADEPSRPEAIRRLVNLGLAGAKVKGK
jgi:hypothetical protein